MCWINKNVAEKRITDVPVECFKIAIQLEDGTIKSYFERFKYKIGECYRVPKLTVKSDCGLKTITEGFHSYCKSFNMCKLCNGVGLISGDFEIHYPYEVCYYNDQGYGRWAKTVLLHCTIPVGSTYYVNTDGCIVSDTIEITGIEDIRTFC